MPFASGTRLGAYEILSLLGAGGMGEIYQARDTRLDRLVAIKVLLTHLSTLPQFRERFEREARAVAALGHPNICALYDIGLQDGLAFLVMEYIEGGSLAERMRARPAPSIAIALRLLRETSDALDKAHRHGIVHRDIKPSNILIDADGHAKLADFGVSKQSAVDLPHAPQITAEGIVVGTPSYMSPEQARGAGVGSPSDVFSLGCILHELVGGRPPFERATTIETLNAVLNEPLPQLTATGCPPGSCGWWTRCWRRSRRSGRRRAPSASNSRRLLPGAHERRDPHDAGRLACTTSAELAAWIAAAAVVAALVGALHLWRVARRAAVPGLSRAGDRHGRSDRESHGRSGVSKPCSAPRSESVSSSHGT